jgi:putative lipoic acid-binding regulatory protein
MDKPHIDYPCPWPYKIIGSHPELMARTVRELLRGKVFDLRESHRSTQGTYTSLSLYVQVHSEAERNEIFRALQCIPTVKIVI